MQTTLDVKAGRIRGNHCDLKDQTTCSKYVSYEYCKPSPSEGRFNLLTPNVNYSGPTALLTSKVAFCIFIQQI